MRPGEICDTYPPEVCALAQQHCRTIHKEKGETQTLPSTNPLFDLGMPSKGIPVSEWSTCEKAHIGSPTIAITIAITITITIAIPSILP